MLQSITDNTANIRLLTNPKKLLFLQSQTTKALDMAEGELLVLINNDLEFQEGLWLNKLVHTITQPAFSRCGWALPHLC